MENKMGLTFLRQMLGRSDYKSSTARYDDRFLIRFLNAHNGNPVEAFEHVKGYLDMKQGHPEYFVKPSEILVRFPKPVFYFQDQRTDAGQFIIYCKPANWDYEKFDLAYTLASFIPFVDYLTLKEPELSKVGPMVIVDMRDWTWSHLSSCRPSHGSLIFRIAEYVSPTKPGPVHVCFESIFVDAVCGMFKPFMSQRLQQQLAFHGEDLSDLYSVVPKRCLPKELDGDNVLKEYTAAEIIEMDQTIKFY